MEVSGRQWRRRLMCSVAVMVCLICLSSWAASGDIEREGGIVFSQPGNEKLKATLYFPGDDGGGLRPGLVAIHGGAWTSGTRHQLRWYCKRFAEQGYVVMTIDYRLMPKYGFPHCLHDSKVAVRWMRSHAAEYRVDPNRIVALGDSAGGHLATMLATTRPQDGLEGNENLGPSSAISAAISLYGVSDLTFYGSDERNGEGRRQGSSFMNKFAKEMKGKGRNPLEAASPITYASPETCPILFIHGTKDRLVAYGQSEAFYERLRALGVPTRLLAVPGRGHAFDFFHWGLRRNAFEVMLAFLDTNGITSP